MGWKERSKCKQLLKCTSVFSLRPRSAKGVRRELAGNLCSWGSQGLRGKPGHPYAPPAMAQGSQAAPGISVGLGMGRGWAGHQGRGELETITPAVYPSLPSLTQASENLIGAALSQYPGDAPWAICEAQSPQEVLSHWAGMVPPPGVPLGCLPKHRCSPTCL